MINYFIYIVLTFISVKAFADRKCVITDGKSKISVSLKKDKDVYRNDHFAILKYLDGITDLNLPKSLNIEYTCEDRTNKISGLALYKNKSIYVSLDFNKNSSMCYPSKRLSYLKNDNVIFVASDSKGNLNYIIHSLDNKEFVKELRLNLKREHKILTAYKLSNGCFYKSYNMSILNYNGPIEDDDEFEPDYKKYMEGLCPEHTCNNRSYSIKDRNNYKKIDSYGIGFGYKTGSLKFKSNEISVDDGSTSDDNFSDSSSTSVYYPYYELFYKKDIVLANVKFDYLKLSTEEDYIKNGVVAKNKYNLNMSSVRAEIGVDLAKINHIDNSVIEVGLTWNNYTAPIISSNKEKSLVNGIFINVSDTAGKHIKNFGYSYDFNNDYELKLGYQYIFNKNIKLNLEGFYHNWSVKDSFRYETKISQYGILTGLVLFNSSER